MSEQTEMAPAREPKAEATYTVQIERRTTVENNGGTLTDAFWQDIATVVVPPRTKRRGIIAKALLDAGIKPGQGDPPRVRVLDEESAAVVEPEPYQPDAEWRVS